MKKEENARDTLLNIISAISRETKEEVTDKIEIINLMPEEDYVTVLNRIRNNVKIRSYGKNVVTYCVGETENTPKLSGDNLNMLNVDENKRFTNLLDRQNATDRISISSEDLTFLKKLYSSKEDEDIIEVPSDLFFSHQIPLTDCEIEVELDSEGKNSYRSMIYRVLIYNDYISIIDQHGSGGGTNINVGCVVVPILGTPGSIIYPIYIKKGQNTIMSISNIGYYNMTKQKCAEFVNSVSKFTLNEGIHNYMATWYGIQIAMLHPQIKKVFQDPEIRRNYSTVNQSSNRNNKKKRNCVILKNM